MDRHRFLGPLDVENSMDGAAPVPAPGAFVLCPIAVPASPWQQVYQIAFEQAQQMLRRRQDLERHRAACWN
jgi:hypothetical protein